MEDQLIPETPTKAVPGERKEKMWRFLQEEKVGDQLVFNVPLAERAAKAIGARRSLCYETLKRFRNDGLVTLTKRAHGEGTLITFLSDMGTNKKDAGARNPTRNHPPKKPKFSGETTLTEALDTLNSEIEQLESRIAEKKSLRDKLRSLIGKES